MPCPATDCSILPRYYKPQQATSTVQQTNIRVHTVSFACPRALARHSVVVVVTELNLR